MTEDEMYRAELAHENEVAEMVYEDWERHKHAVTLLKAYRLRDKRIAERLRFAVRVVCAETDSDQDVLTECADDLERELSEQEAATLLHLGSKP